MLFLGKKKPKPKKLTDFGKVMAEIRLSTEETLRDQAKKLGICASLLCAYSYGERKVNEKILSKIFKNYGGLTERQCEIIMAEVYGNIILERLCTKFPEKSKQSLLEFEIFVISGVSYQIA